MEQFLYSTIYLRYHTLTQRSDQPTPLKQINNISVEIQTNMHWQKLNQLDLTFQYENSQNSVLFRSS